MVKNRLIVERVVQMVMNKKLTPAEAADLLEVSIRTIHNYLKWYCDRGLEGLIDHRKGHYRKLAPNEEQSIVLCKAARPRRSARWIRDRLKLNVSVESVRRVLVKHFNGSGNGWHGARLGD